MNPLRAATLILVACTCPAIAQQASPPQGVTLSIYDTGFGLVSENRRVNLTKGDNEIVIRQVPSRLDPSTCALAPLAASARLNVLDLRYENDLADNFSIFNRYVGRSITVNAGGHADTGVLLMGPRAAPEGGAASAVVIGTEKGARAFYDLKGVDSIDFPNADDAAFLDPALVWSAHAEQEGLQNVRLTYLTAGLGWQALHEMILSADGANASFATRVALRNQSGGRFNDARVRLLATEAVAASDSASPKRYSYGRAEPVAESSGSMQYKGSYELPVPVSLADGQERLVELSAADKLSVTRFHVYDGVRFDRYQRNPRGDWNYGTEFTRAVELYAALALPAGKVRVPGGPVRIYQQLPDGGLDYLGRSEWVEPDESGRCEVRIGAARGISGERERTGFAEVRPQHEYTETFEIRLSNLSQDQAEIRVVEHMYRSPDFEIVKSDTEYISPSPQVLEFRPVLKPGGKQAIHYTVRYRW